MRTRLSTGILLSVWLMSAVAAAGSNGTAIWRSGNSAVPLSDAWDGVSFGSSDSTADVGVWRIMAGAEAPTRAEIIVLGIGESGQIAGMMRQHPMSSYQGIRRDGESR